MHVWVTLATLLAGCSLDYDAIERAGTGTDAGPRDAAVRDARTPDGGPVDSGPEPPADARPEDAGDGDGGPPPACGLCNTNMPAACGADMTCVADPMTNVTFCEAVGTKGENDTCSPGTDTCARGTVCWGAPLSCRLPCDSTTDSDCNRGRCEPLAGSFDCGGICTNNCNPFDDGSSGASGGGGCGPPYRCLIEGTDPSTNPYYTVCGNDDGLAKPGDACGGGDCAALHVCYDGTCRHICSVAGDCASAGGSCTGRIDLGVTGTSVGVCI